MTANIVSRPVTTPTVTCEPAVILKHSSDIHDEKVTNEDEDDLYTDDLIFDQYVLVHRVRMVKLTMVLIGPFILSKHSPC